MKKNKKADLERHRSTFGMIGLSIALGFSFLAFEWRSYEEIEHDKWISLNLFDEIIESPPLIPIPKLKSFVPPKPKVKSEKFEIVDNLEEILQDKPLENEIENKVIPEENFGDLNEGIDNEPLDDLRFSKPKKSYRPDEKPYFLNRRNLRTKSNKVRFNNSVDQIRRKIVDNIYTPDLEGTQISFSIYFEIDTSGVINNINVAGTTNPYIIQSAEKIMAKLPKMAPAKHKGKKRIMPTSIPVLIKYK